MRDPRFDKLASVIVQYSIGVKTNELVRISGPPVAEPLVLALYREVLRAGGHPFIREVPAEAREILLRHGSEEQLAYCNPLALHETGKIDCSIGIWADENTRALTSVPAARQAAVSRAQRPISDCFKDRAARGELRWVGTEFPTQGSAQEAEMSLAEFEDFVFAAGLLHLPDPAAAWRDIHDRQQRVCDRLEQARELRFTTPQGTNLSVAVGGRHWLNCDGHVNFPDGEVYTGPVEDATQGVLFLTFPAVYGGREVSGVRLQFRDGRVVDASADKGEDYLIEMLDQDAGARILGEVAFGTNYAISRFMRNLTFDEKIGGTFHVALGSSYPESGGKNDSALHWDLVCDLREGGRAEMDGELISENGRFLNNLWPQP